MNNSYKVSFKELRQENLKEVFASLERAMTILNIDFYLIGALARDTWFAQEKIRALGTKDIDFAVLVANDETYAQLKKYLIEKEGYVEASGNDYCVIDSAGNQIDLLPFGAVEIESKKILDSTGVVRTDITGFKEVYDVAVEEVNFDDKHVFKVSTLEGIVILKLIAFDDRPEIRNTDIKDIVAIITHYIDLEREMIFEQYTDLFDTSESDDLILVAARSLGRKMQSALNNNIDLKQRIISIIEIDIRSPETASIARLMLGDNIETIEYGIEILKAMLKGITEKLPI